jgi:hypothetical protein
MLPFFLKSINIILVQHQNTDKLIINSDFFLMIGGFYKFCHTVAAPYTKTLFFSLLTSFGRQRRIPYAVSRQDSSPLTS